MMMALARTGQDALAGPIDQKDPKDQTDQIDRKDLSVLRDQKADPLEVGLAHQISLGVVLDHVAMVGRPRVDHAVVADQKAKIATNHSVDAVSKAVQKEEKIKNSILHSSFKK